MTFNPNNTALFPSNEATFFNFLTGQLYPPQIWTYKTNDTVTTVTATDYFKGIGPNQFNVALNQLRVGDLVWASCSDGNTLLQVTALTPDVLLTQYEAIPVGSVSNADVAANAAIAFSKLAAMTSTYMLVGSAGNVPTAVAITGDIAFSNTGVSTIQANAVTTAKILNANVTLAKLAAGITPSHVIKAAGRPTTVGGAAAETFAVAGSLTTDEVFTQMRDNGTGNVTIIDAVISVNGTMSVTFSGNPGNDTIFSYQVIRAAA